MFETERGKCQLPVGRRNMEWKENSKPTCLRCAPGRTPNPTRQTPGWPETAGGMRASAHAQAAFGFGKNPSLPNSNRKKRQAAIGYFFLEAACLAATASLFFCAAVSNLDCFWVDFFWFDFGDLSPIIFEVLRFGLPAACQFLRRQVHPARQARVCK